MTSRRWVSVIVVLGLFLAIAFAGKADAAEPHRQSGTASWFGEGNGVATQWCTWVRRHTRGCGYLAIQSHDTGLVAIAPVIDWCQCYRHDPGNERIVDLQWGVLRVLGLPDPAHPDPDYPDRGLYQVTTWPVSGQTGFAVPDTALQAPR